MIRLSNIVKEGEEPKKFSNEVKKHFLEIVSTYNKYQEMMDRKSDIAEIAEVLGGITEAARELAVNESDDWFDVQTVKRNMSELAKLGSQFDKVAIEAKNLDQRLHGLYEDMGHILSRYYKIGEISEDQMKERLGIKEASPCWDGYKQVGMKMKDGKEVPNCVPTNESIKESTDCGCNSVNEALKHLIHVETPKEITSKNVVNQITALAKKGVRSSEIGLNMGFIGNNNAAVNTFQKVKNKVYFDLDTNESVNEASFIKGKTYGGTKCEGGCYVGKTGLMKLIKISKDNPENVFMFRDDNYSGIQPHFIKNGVIAVANTINPSYDLEKSKVRNLKIGNDVILSVRLFESVNEAAHGYSDSKASYINNHKDEYKTAEKMNNGNEQKFYDSLSALEEKLGHPKYMIFLSNALRGYKVDMYKDPKIKNQQEAEEALFLLSK
jgi:hypothetical protein